MNKFSPGDKVRVRRPENRNQQPSWTPAMDKYHNQIAYIHSVLWPVGSSCRVLLEGTRAYTFHPDWLTPVSDEPKLDLTKPVQTKDGRAVRILCTDAAEPFPIIGLLDGYVHYWYADGNRSDRSNGRTSLVNVPPKPASDTFNVFLQQRGDGKVRLVCDRRVEGITYRRGESTATWKTVARQTVTITEGEGMEKCSCTSKFYTEDSCPKCRPKSVPHQV